VNDTAIDLRRLLKILKDLAKAYASLRKLADDETERELAFSTIRRRAYELLTWLSEEESKPKHTKEK
jgi:hypothetical protein